MLRTKIHAKIKRLDLSFQHLLKDKKEFKNKQNLILRLP